MFKLTYDCIVLGSIGPQAHVFTPSASTVWYFRSNTLSSALFKHKEATNLRLLLSGAIRESTPMLAPWFMRRVARLVSSIPLAWFGPDELAARAVVLRRNSFRAAYTDAAAMYDHAYFVFRCHGPSSSSCGLDSVWHFGLDLLACDFCNIKDPDTGAVTGMRDLVPDEEGYGLVTRLIDNVVVPNFDRVGCTAGNMSPGFLDSLGVTFFCEDCTWAQHGWAMTEEELLSEQCCAELRSDAMDWRAVVGVPCLGPRVVILTVANRWNTSTVFTEHSGRGVVLFGGPRSWRKDTSKLASSSDAR